MAAIEAIEGIGQVSRTRFDAATQSWYAEAPLGALVKIARENERLRTALDKIANPLAYFQRQAEENGAKLDVGMANVLAHDSAWLQSIAKEALGK